ncbi:hypothetical protein KY285_019592 [Solanum tuberosum]|nr:hypothetical protein KY285_019592 [Solanum tuberosum]
MAMVMVIADACCFPDLLGFERCLLVILEGRRRRGEKGLGRVRKLMGWDGGLCLAAKGCWLMFGSLGIGLKKWDWKF